MKQIKKSKIKEKKDTSVRDEIRGLGALIEHVDGNVRLIAEQHTDIKQTLNVHTEMIGSLAVGLEIMKSDLEIVKEDVKTTKVDLEIVKVDVKATKVELGIVKQDVQIIKVDLEVVKMDVQTTKVDIEIIKGDVEFIKNGMKKKVDVDEFAALERRVLLLEKRR